MTYKQALDNVLEDIRNLDPDEKAFALSKALVSCVCAQVLKQEATTGVSWANPDVTNGPLKSVLMDWSQFSKTLVFGCSSFDCFA